MPQKHQLPTLVNSIIKIKCILLSHVLLSKTNRFHKWLNDVYKQPEFDRELEKFNKNFHESIVATQNEHQEAKIVVEWDGALHEYDSWAPFPSSPIEALEKAQAASDQSSPGLPSEVNSANKVKSLEQFLNDYPAIADFLLANLDAITPVGVAYQEYLNQKLLKAYTEFKQNKTAIENAKKNSNTESQSQEKKTHTFGVVAVHNQKELPQAASNLFDIPKNSLLVSASTEKQHPEPGLAVLPGKDLQEGGKRSVAISSKSKVVESITSRPTRVLPLFLRPPEKPEKNPPARDKRKKLSAVTDQVPKRDTPSLDF